MPPSAAKALSEDRRCGSTSAWASPRRSSRSKYGGRGIRRRRCRADVALRLRWKHLGGVTLSCNRFGVEDRSNAPDLRGVLQGNTRVYMDAMVMPIPVRDAKALDALKPRALVDFTLVVTRRTLMRRTSASADTRAPSWSHNRHAGWNCSTGWAPECRGGRVVYRCGSSGFHLGRPDREQDQIVAIRGQSVGVFVHLYKLPIAELLLPVVEQPGTPAKNALRNAWGATWCC